MRTRARRRKTVRTVVWWVVACLVVIIAAVAWVGVRGYLAKGDLEAAQASIGTLKQQAVAFDTAGAKDTLKKISKDTASARDLTGDPVWRTVEFVPILGKNLTAVRELAALTDDVVTDVAAPLIDVAGAIDPKTLLKDSAVDVTAFTTAAPFVHEANVGAEKASAFANRIDTDGTIGQVVAAHKTVAGLITEIAPALATLDKALPLLPGILGADGPRSYAIAFQNPAEARALGGTSLFFALISVDNGRIQLQDVIPAGFANFPRSSESIVPIPDGVGEVYPDGAFGTFIANATVRPDFPSAAEIIDANWQQSIGGQIDGVISIDPVALSYILRASDPMKLSTGDTVDSKNLVPFLLNEVYQRYNTDDIVSDNLAQNAVYAEVVQATFAKLTGGSLKPAALVSALVQATSERRMLLWSTHEDEQAQYAALGLDGALPKSDSTTQRVGVYTQDAVGSKLNYYLTEAVHLESSACTVGDAEAKRVSVDLASSVPADTSTLSPSITGNWESEGLEPGFQRVILMLYSPPGSTITNATVNGEPYSLENLHDTDYPVGKVTVIVPPQGKLTVSYDFTAPKTGATNFEAIVTPLVHATPVDSRPVDCSTFAAG